jgi:hypothetical protein
MKNLKYYIIISLAMLTLSNCENNFDPKIYGSFTQSSFPKSKSDYESVIMACYLPFTSHWNYTFGNSGYQHTWYSPEGGVMRLFDTTSDIMAPWVTGGGSEWTRFSEADFTNCVNYSRGKYGQNMINHFQTLGEITRMTQILGVVEDAPEKDFDATTKKNWEAEVRLCRGLHMYYALHTYGPLPCITDVDKIYSDSALYLMTRPTLDEAVQKITDDFEFAVENMPEKVTEKGRYTKDFARFCLMRHYLNEGSHVTGYYQKAVDLYTAMKGRYSLYTAGTNPYAEQFASAHKFNSEVIMSISVNPEANNATLGNYNANCMYMIPSEASMKAADNPDFGIMGACWAQYYNISSNFYDSFEANDLRAKTITTSYKAKDGATRTKKDFGSKWDGYIINKFKPEVAGTYQPMDVPMARWADVLLMFAEAETRANNTVSSEAVTAVNEVRSRAGLANLSSDKTATVDAFLSAILNERGHELFFEGCRKIDLIRFNVYAQKCKTFKGYVPTSQYMPIPNFAVVQAAEHGVNLEQTYSRPGWENDLNLAK